MIRHCVMLGLPKGYDASELDAVMQGLSDLVLLLPGSHGFAAGVNRDFEARTPDHPFGFTIDFDSRADLSTYAGHPTHHALSGRLRALCGGGAGIAVYDLDCAPTAVQ